MKEQRKRTEYEQAEKGRVPLVAWLDIELKDWVKLQAERDFRGNMTYWLESVLRTLQKTGKVKIGD